MKYNELQVSSNKSGRRVGRGTAAGRGKTAGRGTKGQGARTGSKAKPGFAGGANPLMQQLPKLPGFKSHRPKAENIYTGQLEQFSGKTVDAKVLADAGLVSSAYVKVKLLNKGELSKKVIVKLPAASQGAIDAVQAAGGSFEVVERLRRSQTSDKKSRQKTKQQPEQPESTSK